MLLNTDPNAKSEKEAPKDARYFSDRNTTVEKEQRARNTQVMPQPQKDAIPQRGAKSIKSQAMNRSLKDFNLADLGMPLKFKNKPQVAQAPVNGGDQALSDDRLAEGDRNLLNTEESVYYSFYSRVYQTIGPIWESYAYQVMESRSFPQGEYYTYVDVVFDREGKIVRIIYLKSSGVKEFDDIVDRAWKQTPRFPNPPKGLLNSDGEIHTNFGFRVSINQGGGFRWYPVDR